MRHILIFIKIAFESDNYGEMFQRGMAHFIDMSFNRVRKRVVLPQTAIIHVTAVFAVKQKRTQAA
ncbi:hypothetical protein [Burkholderia sp. Bp8992]|uniref:hypothetical protein n=1 Tax=Burkholderia sp. Bp8992 TaxID=2184554 RepID=UPI000F55CBA7|nr:hypothetical protein [Burkholderia sp. Bp8992]